MTTLQKIVGVDVELIAQRPVRLESIEVAFGRDAGLGVEDGLPDFVSASSEFLRFLQQPIERREEKCSAMADARAMVGAQASHGQRAEHSMPPFSAHGRSATLPKPTNATCGG